MDSSLSSQSLSAVPMKNYDGTIMLDHHGRTIYQSQFLSTHPIRSDCKERVGYAGRKFTYLSGEGVIRTMNLVFGNTGWSSEVIMERLVQCEKDEMGRWVIGYLAKVRISLTTGTSHEDFGSGEGINENKIKCHEKALKSAVTDALKRAARHLGDRLGNALYVKGAGIKTAPIDNKQAIENLDRKEIHRMFGDQNKLREKFAPQKDVTTTETTTVENKCNQKTAGNTVNTETEDKWPTNSTKEQHKTPHETDPAAIIQNQPSPEPKITNNPYRRPISIPSPTSHSHNGHNYHKTPNAPPIQYNKNSNQKHVNRYEQTGPHNIYPSFNNANANGPSTETAQPSRISMESNSNFIREGIHADTTTDNSNRRSSNLDKDLGQTYLSGASSKNMQSNILQNDSSNIILNEIQQHQQNNQNSNYQTQFNRFSNFNYPSSSSSSSASSSPSPTAVITPNNYLAKNKDYLTKNIENGGNNGFNINGIHRNESTINRYTRNSSEENSIRKRQFNDENEAIIDAYANDKYVSNKRNLRNPYNR